MGGITSWEWSDQRPSVPGRHTKQTVKGLRLGLALSAAAAAAAGSQGGAGACMVASTLRGDSLAAMYPVCVGGTRKCKGRVTASCKSASLGGGVCVCACMDAGALGMHPSREWLRGGRGGTYCGCWRDAPVVGGSDGVVVTRERERLQRDYRGRRGGGIVFDALTQHTHSHMQHTALSLAGFPFPLSACLS